MKNKIFLLFFIFSSNNLFGIINLEKLVQDFVIETKQIKIPGYRFIFNPSITRWNKKLLMSFRIRDGKTTNKIGLVWLDTNFKPQGNPHVIKLNYDKPLQTYMHQPGGPQEQDPRLIVIGNKLYMIYSHYQVRKVFITEVTFEENNFIAKNSIGLLNFEGSSIFKREKNWAPFKYKDQLLLVYSISPHKILHPNLEVETCETIAFSKNNCSWPWGELRGGTPALKINDDYYLSFFHSCKDIATVQSQSQKMLHYFMGAYLFSTSYPFNITHMSLEPIVAKNFYEKPNYNLYRPLRVVYPGGFVQDDNFFWVFYGRHDNEVWYVKLDKKKLLSSLVKV